MIDDNTTRYILAAQKHFEDLKQVAAQLAGFLVLQAAGSREAAPDHPMLGSAKELYANAADGLRTLPATPRSRNHHAHLLAAVGKLGTAFSADDPLGPLQDAFAELRSASRSLPGFEMVSFEHCCCHPGSVGAK